MRFSDSSEGNPAGASETITDHLTERRQQLRRRMSRRCVRPESHSNHLVGCVHGGPKGFQINAVVDLEGGEPSIDVAHTRSPRIHTYSISRALSASELQEWDAEHTWRTACFMYVRAYASRGICFLGVN